MEAATKQYVDNALLGYLPLTGGTLSGSLTLAGDPIQPMQAATKNYVDLHAGLVTVAASPPSNPLQGKLWYDSISCQLYIWYRQNGLAQWVQANVPTFGGGQPGGTFGGIYYGDDPPDNPPLGAIWITTGGNMFSWNGTIWVAVGGTGAADIYYGPVPPVTPNIGMLWIQPNGTLQVWTGGAWTMISNIIVSDGAPTNTTPGTNNKLWWDSVGGHMFVWFQNEWVITDAGGTGSGVPS
jgi:hypothetical protein